MSGDAALVGAFAGLRVVVVGDAMLDRYARGAARRLAAEAPAPVISEIAWEDRAGGAANAAAGAAALGARVSLVSLAGSDAAGAALVCAVEAAGVEAGGIARIEGRGTLTKTRLMAGGQLVARIDEGDGGAPSEADGAALAEALGARLEGADAVIVSDYAYGTICAPVLERLAAWRAEGRGRLIADARDLARLAPLRPCAVTPNGAEAAALIGSIPAGKGAAARLAQMAEGAPDLLGRTGARAVVVTLDADGAAILQAGRAPLHVPAAARAESADVTGGGDTFAAALALALAAGAGIEAAARLACRAACIAVSKPGTATCTATELRTALAPAAPLPAILPSAGALGMLGERLRAEGRRVVFTNGCFDILHEGHLGYLEEARALGDALVVGVNSDASVRRLKGPMRPVNACAARLRMLAALSFVDHVVAFEEERPDALIAALRPHVFAKGGDYDRASLPEAALVEALGGEVRLLPYRAGRSTTGIIARIRGEGAAPSGARAAQ